MIRKVILVCSHSKYFSPKDKVSEWTKKNEMKMLPFYILHFPLPGKYSFYVKNFFFSFYSYIFLMNLKVE